MEMITVHGAKSTTHSGEEIRINPRAIFYVLKTDSGGALIHNGTASFETAETFDDVVRSIGEVK